MFTDGEGLDIPYRVDELIASGDHYQIAGGRTEEGEGVAIRAILYGDDSENEVEFRRASLRRQWAFLEDVGDHPVVSGPVEWLEVDASPVDRPPEPVAVVERVDGPDLSEWIEAEHPAGMQPEAALDLISDLVDFLTAVHDRGWLWRDFDPRRFAVDADGGLRARSIGCVLQRERGTSVVASEIDQKFTAPELRGDVGPKLRRPAGDLYGVGALSSFVLTGELPRHRVESPLSYTAHERIREWETPGVELLVAKLLQPMAKDRLQSAERLLEFCDVETLPGDETPGFDDCELPAPWVGLDIDNPEENRGLKSSLSSGPLVSMSSGRAGEKPEETINWPVIIGVIVAVVAAAAIAVFTGP